MANKIRHIKGRNLVVCETFDDFAAAVNKTDFVVEDVVGYVTSLTNVYYWLNVESVWGAIGFTWDYNPPMTPEESAQYLNIWKRMEHVLSTGYNIDKKNPEDPDEEIPNDRPEGPMPGEEGYEYSEANKFDIAQKRRSTPITKGYGHFNRTTIPFSHIPTLPDGYRITAITGATLANINSDIKTIYIDKSDWENLTDISNICNRAITLYADLDGAPITIVTSLIAGNVANRLYLKADLSNVINGSTLFNSSGSNLNSYLVANDSYKDLNFPIGKDNSFFTYIHGNAGNRPDYGDRDYHPGLRWEGEGPFKLEYFFDIKDYTSIYMPPTGYGGGNRGVVKINSKNGKFLITNYTNYTPLTLNKGNGIHLYINGTGDASAVDLTIDCTNGISDVRCDYDLAIRNEGNGNTYRMLPIKYEGNVTTIGIYNPFLKIINNEWPAYDQTLVNKLEPALGEYILKGINIEGAIRKCPYTIDARSLSRIRVFINAKYTIASGFESYDADYKAAGKNVADIYPEIIVDTSKVYSVFDMTCMDSQPRRLCNIKAIKTLSMTWGPYNYIGFAKNSLITCSRVEGSTYYSSMWVYDASTPTIHLTKLSDTVTLNYRFFVNDWAIMSNNRHVNIVTVDATDEELMAGTITTCINKSLKDSYYIIDHPLILTNNAGFRDAWHYYKNFRLIYRHSITLRNNSYTNDELIDFAECFRETNNSEIYNVQILTEIHTRMGGLYTHGMNLIDYISSLGYIVSDLS